MSCLHIYLLTLELFAVSFVRPSPVSWGLKHCIAAQRKTKMHEKLDKLFHARPRIYRSGDY